MTIGVIGGTGGQGLGIAVRFVEAGEEVIIGSRTLEKAQAAVDKVKELLGDVKNVRAMANPDAAKAADVLVLTVPLAAQKDTLLSIKEGAAGKPLMDATGPLESCIGGSATKYI
ncbi:NAD(P)-binding domain-containing protein, partial [Methanoculleus sp.]|uniref:NAD(P)-binding domain-containing protein n=1 Tax=Methanoculleus sp. TaxID=90427 RepID=UPI002FC6655C